MAHGETAGEAHARGKRTAGEAGWHESRYNVRAAISGSTRVAIANLYAGTCTEFTEVEQYLLSVVEELPEHHPFIERFAARGVICNFNEQAALLAMARSVCARPGDVSLTICPTMGCNFACPYCFESHRGGAMSADVAGEVAALAERMLSASRAKRLRVTWFGGEPLLAPQVIEQLSEQLIGLAEEHGAAYSASIVTNGYLLTPEVAEMLGRARVERAQVTLDGIGTEHDATRPLAGGGATFERIVANLSRPGLPFEVIVRHNVHAGNLAQVEPLRSLVAELAEASGNRLVYHASAVVANEASSKRGSDVSCLSRSARAELMLGRYASKFGHGSGHYCGAHSLWHLGIDERGRLYKCWETVDKPELSFGSAHSWDPANPLATAEKPNLLTAFLNSTGATASEECLSCTWLPVCRGGCPYQRLFAGGRRCFLYKDDPERYVLALLQQKPRPRKRASGAESHQ